MGKKDKNKKVNNKPFTPINLAKLKFLIVIVKKGHGVAVNNMLLDSGSSMTTLLFAQGTKEKYVMDILGGDERDKEVIITLVSEKFYPSIKEKLEKRFSISQASKGVLLTFDVDSMAGVLAYKYLSDYQGARKYGK